MRILIVLGFVVALDCSAQPFKPIYSFGGTPTDGAEPEGKLTMDSHGVLYGTTISGGTGPFGTVFSATPPSMAGGKWVEAVLYNFGDAAMDGMYPSADLVIGPDGSLFGTTPFGGAGACGTVFQLSPPQVQSGAWTETRVHDFFCDSEGGNPQGGVILGADGRLYGGTSTGYFGSAVIYSLTPPVALGDAWAETVLHTFTGPDGADPSGDLIFGPNGGLYGTTQSGGDFSGGTAFQLSPPKIGETLWTLTTLHSFGVYGDGAVPATGVVIGLNGNLYGTTSGGGLDNGGTIFELVPPAQGSDWTENALYKFQYGYGSNTNPSALTHGRGGSFFGTNAVQFAFRLAPPDVAGGAWSFTVLHTFTGGTYPEGGVIFDKANGLLYGGSINSGAHNAGNLYEIAP